MINILQSLKSNGKEHYFCKKKSINHLHSFIMAAKAILNNTDSSVFKIFPDAPTMSIAKQRLNLQSKNNPVKVLK